MAVIQEAFDIPEDILTGIITGEFKRLGGVVRHAKGPEKGQIVTHLKPVETNELSQVQKNSLMLSNIIKNNKKAIIATGVIVAVTAAGGLIIYKCTHKEEKAIKSFKKTLKKYVKLVKEGKVNETIIEEMLLSLKQIQESKECEKIQLQLSAEELSRLVNVIQEYTVNLAQNNKIELLENEKINSGNSIVDFQNYLSAQKRIFLEA